MVLSSFETLLTRLADSGVRFVLVGAVAGVVHGMSRATFDVDVCYWRHPDNIERLCASLADLHPTVRIEPAPPGFRMDPPTVYALQDLPLSTDAGPIDLLAAIDGLGDYESLLGHSLELDLYGRSIRVLTLDGLIAAKQATGRPQDLADLAALEALRALSDVDDNA